MNYVRFCFAILCLLNLNVFAQEGYNNDPEVDYSKCENCLTFPREYMEVNQQDLIDFTNIPEHEQLHFLIGEWQLYYPGEKSAAYEKFNWFVEGVVIEGFQDWTFNNTAKIPWRAKSFFRYIQADKRWQFQWISSNSSSIFTGGLEQSSFVFYENEFSGGPKHLSFKYPAKYVFKNITKNSFVVEWFDSNDNGTTYSQMTWRLFYKRRVNKFKIR